MTAHECEEYIEEPPQRKRYALRKPERQRDFFLETKLTLPSERRTGKPPPDPLLVLCRLQIHRGSRCSTVTKIPDTTVPNMYSYVDNGFRADRDEEGNVSIYFTNEKFYLHPMVFSIHPIREMGYKYGVCVIWGV